MGKLNFFEISLSSSECVYHAGQMLQGIVTVDLTEEMKLRGIRITFRGKAFVHWTEQNMRGPGESRHREVRHFSSKEDYFDHSVILFGAGSGDHHHQFVLPPGRYTYPFQFQLPLHLPSSFEGEHGHVRYWIKCSIEKPWKYDHQTKAVFTVIGPLDLNTVSTANNPAQGTSQKNLCCMCCASGPITAMLSIDRRGYVPGEPISINAEVVNLANRKVGNTSVELKMTTFFRTALKSRSVTRQIAKLKHDRIEKGETDIWNNELLHIPSIPPSNLRGCSVIDINYVLELRVDPAGPAFDLSVPIGILIGTAPLHASVQQYVAAHQLQDNSSPPPPYSSASGSGHPHNLLITTYRESIFGKVSVREEDESEYIRGDSYYAPLYTYYMWTK